MRNILKPILALSFLILSACANQLPTAVGGIFSRQIVFTVTDYGWRASLGNTTQNYNSMLDSADEGHEADRHVKAQHSTQNIIKSHCLKKISQSSIEALGVEAVVAEFRPDRNMSEVVSDLRKDTRVESV